MMLQIDQKLFSESEKQAIYTRSTRLPCCLRNFSCLNLLISTREKINVLPLYSFMSCLWKGQKSLTDEEDPFKICPSCLREGEMPERKEDSLSHMSYYNNKLLNQQQQQQQQLRSCHAKLAWLNQPLGLNSSVNDNDYRTQSGQKKKERWKYFLNQKSFCYLCKNRKMPVYFKKKWRL